MGKKSLSIIVVNYKTPQVTSDCINSIIKSINDINYEVIVVDNASKDGSVATLKKMKGKADIKIVELNHNEGFAKGNIEGIKKSSGKYLLLLNSDTLLTRSFLKDFIEEMEDKKFGIATCLLIGKDGKLQMPGGYFPSLFRVACWMFFIDDIPLVSNFLTPYHLRPSMASHELDWITGAFFMMKREVWDSVGSMDTDYFMYVEDTDFCYRAKQKDWTVGYLPNHSIIHLGGASSKNEFPILKELEGICLFYRKHKPAWQLEALRFVLKAGCILRFILLGIMNRPVQASIYVKAFAKI